MRPSSPSGARRAARESSTRRAAARAHCRGREPAESCRGATRVAPMSPRGARTGDQSERARRQATPGA
eukprot:5448524-Alexandrium_andersonii.AAC.1